MIFRDGLILISMHKLIALICELSRYLCVNFDTNARKRDEKRVSLASPVVITLNYFIHFTAYLSVSFNCISTSKISHSRLRFRTKRVLH